MGLMTLLLIVLGWAIAESTLEFRSRRERPDKPLFNPGPQTHSLTDRQNHALELLQANPQGLRSSDLGRAIHVRKGCPYCSDKVICKYAHSTGEEIGRALRKKDLAIKRRSGKWELLPAARPRDTGSFPETF